MSWPQNPNDPQRPQPAQGFGPPPAWPPTGGPAGHPQQPPAPPQQHPYPPQPHQPYPAGPMAPPGQQPYPPGQPYGQPHYGAPQHPGQQRYPGQQPYPGQRPYQGQPAPSTPAGTGGARRGVLIGGGIAAALVLITGGVYLATSHGGPSSAAAGANGSASAPAPAPSEEGPQHTSGTAEPLVAGWQTQTQEEHGFRYDVPPASARWTLNASDIQISYSDKDGNPVVGMSGTTEYREGGCASKGSHTGAIQAGRGQLATTGTQGSDGGTLQKNAYNVAGNWVWAAYGGPTNKDLRVSVSTPVRWTRNGIDGYMAKATATNIVRPSACVPPRGVAYGISQRLPDGTVSEWVLYADQGVPNALSTAEITRIMDTVRPYHGG